MQKDKVEKETLPELEEFFLIETFGPWILEKDFKTIQVFCLAKGIINKWKEVKAKNGQNK